MGKDKNDWRTDLFEFPIFSFELVILFTELSGVFKILYRRRGEWLMRNGRGTHDDVSIWRWMWGKHWGRSAGHYEGEGGQLRKEEGEKRRGEGDEREKAGRDLPVGLSRVWEMVVS